MRRLVSEEKCKTLVEHPSEVASGHSHFVRDNPHFWPAAVMKALKTGLCCLGLCYSLHCVVRLTKPTVTFCHVCHCPVEREVGATLPKEKIGGKHNRGGPGVSRSRSLLGGCR